MPATGPDRTRRALLLGLAALARAADPAADAWEVVTGLAAALGRGSDVEFLAWCDPQLAGYSTLRANVSALVVAAEVESGIDPVKNEGDAQKRDVEIDWTMRLINRSGVGKLTERRETVRCGLEKRGRAWKVVRIEPVAFFAPSSV
jgi:hypothetical protein